MDHPIELPAWFQRLRQSEVVDPVLQDPRSVGDTRLGVNRNIAFQEVIGGGQADFDQRWHNSKGHDLAPDDRVLLYAFFNQLGHLEELIAACAQLFKNSAIKAPIVVDIGCGPFTGGFAIASILGQDPQVDYIGVDRSSAMRRLGERLASAGEHKHSMPRIRRCWAKDIASIDWHHAPGWRPVIVIVSYLLASPTLDAPKLVAELDKLLTRLSRGPVALLYTNATRPDANKNFLDFSGALHCAGFGVVVEPADGAIAIHRPDGARLRRLRYALFHRPQQNTLRLQDPHETSDMG